MRSSMCAPVTAFFLPAAAALAAPLLRCATRRSAASELQPFANLGFPRRKNDATNLQALASSTTSSASVLLAHTALLRKHLQVICARTSGGRRAAEFNSSAAHLLHQRAKDVRPARMAWHARSASPTDGRARMERRQRSVGVILNSSAAAPPKPCVPARSAGPRRRPRFKIGACT